MSVRLQQVKQIISTLSPEEAKQAGAWCGAFGGHPIIPTNDPFAEHAYSEFATCFRQHNRTTSPPPHFSTWSRNSRRAERERFLDGVDHTKDCITDWWPETTRITRLGLLRFLCRVAFEECAHRRPDVRWRDLALALLQIEATVSRSFPGWTSQGLFQRIVLERVTHHKQVAA